VSGTQAIKPTRLTIKLRFGPSKQIDLPPGAWNVVAGCLCFWVEQHVGTKIVWSTLAQIHAGSFVDSEGEHSAAWCGWRSGIQGVESEAIDNG
jgi:hypothetical protein